MSVVRDCHAAGAAAGRYSFGMTLIGSARRRGGLGPMVVAGAAALVAPLAHGQTSGFSLVDQTVEDVSPLSTSLQLLQPDAGPPQDFGRVYTHPDYPGQYLRIQGALIMAFPQSEYLPTEDGIVAIFPESTVFYIGGKPDSFNEPTNEEPTFKPSPYYLDYRLNAQTETLLASAVAERRREQERLAMQQRAAAEPTFPTMWSSENYRQSRVGQLMRAAATVR